MRRIAPKHGTSSPPHLVSQMHARSGSRSSIIKHRTSSPPRSSSPVDIPPQKVSLFVGNQAPFKGQRANVKDYEEPVPTLLLKVIREYSASIWACHPFPSQQQQGGWANSMWYNVSRQDPEGAYVLTERMRKLITSRGSHARGYLKDKICPLVGPAYGFKTLTDKPAIIAKNLKIYTSLISNSSFHYKDPCSLSGYCGHSIILDAVRGIWFNNQAAPGLEFSSYFSPIRIVSLALILTAIEFCIQEFSTGRFVQAVFDEKDNKLRFEAHLQDLMEWAELKPDITDKILQKMHDRCRKGTGAAMDLGGCLNDKTRQRALLELEARTGDTDTDSNEEGR
ncbi:hypothetical protein BDZ94DRAFT_1272833 [Collybia nuda]|uniref:DUF6532 domain-containing protein n=1 Tax=Collybia nuda TaxID=64659 RepID=A0A9P5XU30_9AGAR|nr:hypothetical protein BDZ94DRAFT_1272833 [Collybia nuda]